MTQKQLLDILLKARGLTKKELADTIGVPYHSLAKTLKPTPFYLKSGEMRFRECRYIREAVARWLGVPYEFVWGPNATLFLKRLAREEVERQAEARKQEKLQALGL